MLLYFLFTLACTIGMCFGLYRYFGLQIHQLNLKLDDGRGYFLISVLLDLDWVQTESLTLQFLVHSHEAD